MSRLKLVSVDEMTPGQRDQYDKFPSNLTRGLLLADERLARALPSLANALRASGLDPKMREGVILRVAALSDSAYEHMQHLDQARKAGWSDREIAAIETGDATSLSPAFGAILAFVDQAVTTPKMSDEVFAAARSVLSDRDVATVILLIGHYMMVARFLGILEIELDAEPDAWASEH